MPGVCVFPTHGVQPDGTWAGHIWKLDNIGTYALMPIGYPRDKFGPVRRKPLSAVAIRDRWGNPWLG